MITPGLASVLARQSTRALAPDAAPLHPLLGLPPGHRDGSLGDVLNPAGEDVEDLGPRELVKHELGALRHGREGDGEGHVDALRHELVGDLADGLLGHGVGAWVGFGEVTPKPLIP